MSNTFSDKLATLLSNSKFKNLVNSLVEDKSDINSKEYKEELKNKKINKLKKKRFDKINEKRYQKNNKNNNNKSNVHRKEKKIISADSEEDINSDKCVQSKKEEEIIPNIFFLKDKDNNDKMYSFHRVYKEYYYLRCSDRHCNGTAKYNTLSGIITENNQCNIEFENHSYAKESIIKKKIESNTIKKDEIENNIKNQEIYFKYMLSIHPLINYYDIVLLLHEKYNITKILYSLSQFNTYKKNLKNENKFYQERENLIDNIKFENENLLKIKIEYNEGNVNSEKNIIRIYGIKESLKLLDDDDVTQYFIDGTYKCVPNAIKSAKVLIILIAYNARLKKFELCIVSTFSKEDKETFKQFYSLLKTKYNFNPKRITCDFSKANIEALKTIYGEGKVIIITCFFHLIQSWWRRANKLGMRKKNIIHKTRNLIFNLKLIPFMSIENAREYYLKIKDYFNEDLFNNFYTYFEQTWLNLDENETVKFDFNIWSYYKKFDFKNARKKVLISKESLDEYIFVSNNCCESLNNLINNFIQINSKISLNRFEAIIKTLFIRMECNRSNENQIAEGMIHKRVLSDVLLDIINNGFGFNNNIINESQFKKLKLKPDEGTIFKIIYNDNNDNNNNDDINDSLESEKEEEN